jgi:hypothetical protein
LLIYKKGGVYLDIKSRMSRPLDEIIAPDDRYLLAKWGDYHVVVHSRLAHIPRGEFQNWHVIAARGHPFLKAVIDRVLQNIDRYRPWLHGVGKSAVLHVTGPVPYTLAINPLLDRYPHRSVAGQEEIGLEYSAVAGETHVRLFATHYSQLEESVVMLTGPAAVLSNLYLNSGTHLMIRRVKNRLKDLRDERRARRARASVG